MDALGRLIFIIRSFLLSQRLHVLCSDVGLHQLIVARKTEGQHILILVSRLLAVGDIHNSLLRERAQFVGELIVRIENLVRIDIGIAIHKSRLRLNDGLFGRLDYRLLGRLDYRLLGRLDHRLLGRLDHRLLSFLGHRFLGHRFLGHRFLGFLGCRLLSGFRRRLLRGLRRRLLRGLRRRLLCGFRRRLLRGLRSRLFLLFLHDFLRSHLDNNFLVLRQCGCDRPCRHARHQNAQAQDQ